MDTTQPISTPTQSASRRIVLIIGDLITLILFAVIGRSTHGEAAGFDAAMQVLETAAPFLIGWFVAAPFVGAFRANLLNRPGALLGRTALAWLIACPIGLGLRALIRQSPVIMTFALVTFATVLLMLLVWRGLFVLITRRSFTQPGSRTA